MTLIQLRYLVAIVDAGLNISVAAQRTHSTQPGLSKQLGQMEDELGFKVFVRRGKRLEALTEPGREVVERAKVILSEAANIRALADNRRKESQGEMRIVTTATQARYVLPELLASMREKFPEVGLHISAASEAEALGQIDQGLADIAIVSATQEPKTGHLVLPLYRWEMIGLAAADHRLSRETGPLRLEDLADVALMTYDSARAADSAYALAFVQRGLAPAPLVATARDSELIKSLVRSGAGVGLLAEMAWTPADADLARLKVGHLFGRCTAWAVLPRDRIPRRHVLEFVTAIAPHLDQEVLRTALDDAREAPWPAAPLWRELHGPAAFRSPDPRTAPLRSALRLVAQA